VLSRYGFMYMPLFGFVATLHAFGAIPLLLLTCTVLLLVLIEVISRFSSFSFRKPLAVTFLGVTLLAFLISFAINETPMHEYVRAYAKDHRMDMISRTYDRPVPFRSTNGIDVLRGEVVAVSTGEVSLTLFNGETITAYATTSKRMLTLPKIGEDVVIFGAFSGDRFFIADIRKASSRYFGKHGHGGGISTIQKESHGKEKNEIMK